MNKEIDSVDYKDIKEKKLNRVYSILETFCRRYLSRCVFSTIYYIMQKDQKAVNHGVHTSCCNNDQG